MATGRKGLGRGLSALMADMQVGPEAVGAGGPRGLERRVPIEQVRPNPEQPRRSFDTEKLEELAASIRQLGIIQPLVVRAVDDGFEIVAGERRWRAAQLAQLHEVPVLVRDYDAIEVLQIAVVENVQRADLNPVDEANAYAMLVGRFGHSQAEVAEVVGKSRSHIANMIRLRELPPAVLEHLEAGRLSAGHARPLIGAANAEELAARIVARNLSVREVERLVARDRPAAPRRQRARGGADQTKDADTLALERDLSAALRLKVEIEHVPGAEGGRVILRYDSLADLDRLCGLLSSGGEPGAGTF